MGWEWNQLTPGSFLISVIGSNPSQKPQGNSGSLNFLENGPMLSLKSVGCFALPLQEGFSQGYPSLGCTHPLCSRIQGANYSKKEPGAARARRAHLPTVLSPVAMLMKEEKVEEIHAPRCRNESNEKKQQSPEVQISQTHSWLPGALQNPQLGEWLLVYPATLLRWDLGNKPAETWIKQPGQRYRALPWD